jgi:hypothetical protein
MRRLILCCLAVLLIAGASNVTAQAQNPTPTPTPVPTAVPRGTIISLPAANETVRGRVRVWGSAWVDGFVRYEVRIGPAGTDPVYIAGGSQPIINGLIYEWNTAGLKDGNYVIAIRSIKPDGNYQEVRVAVRLDNTTPPTPTSTPTESATSTPEPTRTPVVLSTSTPQRTATPLPATTPLPQGGLLPGLPPISLDPTAMCLRPLLLGGAAAGGFFLLVGLLALLRGLIRGLLRR